MKNQIFHFHSIWREPWLSTGRSVWRSTWHKQSQDISDGMPSLCQAECQKTFQTSFRYNENVARYTRWNARVYVRQNVRSMSDWKPEFMSERTRLSHNFANGEPTFLQVESHKICQLARQKICQIERQNLCQTEWDLNHHSRSRVLFAGPQPEKRKRRTG